LRVEAGLGLREIGKSFGVSHSTVSHQVGWVRWKTEKDERFARKVLNCHPKT
jgi:chromosomal replication initiation ATPase DnaA